MTAWERSRTMMHLREVGVMRDAETMKKCGSDRIRSQPGNREITSLKVLLECSH